MFKISAKYRRLKGPQCSMMSPVEQFRNTFAHSLIDSKEVEQIQLPLKTAVKSSTFRLCSNGKFLIPKSNL